MYVEEVGELVVYSWSIVFQAVVPGACCVQVMSWPGGILLPEGSGVWRTRWKGVRLTWRRCVRWVRASSVRCFLMGGG